MKFSLHKSMQANRLEERFRHHNNVKKNFFFKNNEEYIIK